jgi:CheY-like chemotaxis protein
MRLAVVAPRGHFAAATEAVQRIAGGQPVMAVTAPLYVRDLWRLVDAALHRTVPDTVGRTADLQQFRPPPLEEAHRAGAAILVAEDNEANQFVIGRVLDRLGYAHEIVPDGTVALQRVAARRYGLLISDYHMPTMDGLALTLAIRARETEDLSRPRLPILALTADAMPEVEARCREAGMDGCMRKPIDIDRLAAAIETMMPQALPLRRPALAAAGPAGAPRPLPALDPQVFDIARLQRLFSRIDDEALQLLDDYLASLAERIPALQAALDRDDHATARSLAHAAKGASGNLGATELHKLFERLQRVVDSGDIATARGLAEVLPHAAGRLGAAIDRLRADAAA